MSLTPKRWIACLTAAAAVCMTGESRASSINMLIGNVQVQFFDGNESLFDVPDSDVAYNELTMTFDEGEAQPVSSTELQFGQSTVDEGLLMAPDDDLFIDLLIPGLGPSLSVNALEQNQGGPGAVLNWFTGDGEFVRLALDPITYTALDFPGLGTSFSFVTSASVVDQNLPLDLVFDDNVLVSFSATETMFLGGGTSLTAIGSVTISGDGVLVPEPAAATAVASVLCVGLSRVRRR